MASDDRLAFLAEWYDPTSCLLKRYTLLYFVKDGTLEMVDMKTGKVFLKRTKAENVRLNDLYIGGSVNILSRMLTVIDFADEFTRRKLTSSTEKTFAMVKPTAVSKVGEILTAIHEKDLKVVNFKMCVLNRYEALAFYREYEVEGKSWLQDMVHRLTDGPLIAMELMGNRAVSVWRELIGPTDPSEARKVAPRSLRAKYGTDVLENAVHGSIDQEHAENEIEFFFPKAGGTRSGTAKRVNSTLGVIKPHALSDGIAGKIIADIMAANFNITAMSMFHLDRVNAEEFLEVYRGVVAEFTAMVEELTLGPCIALEISAAPEDEIHHEFREFCGPADPEIGRHLRPRTLRAKYGIDKVRNAIHCTDLPEDAPLEVQFFFQILDK